MNRFLAIFERDVRKFVRNPIVVMVSILMPLVYLVIIGNSMQGELKRLPIALVDMDKGPEAIRLTALVRTIESSTGSIRLFETPDESLAMQGVRDGLYKAALVIPPGFSRDISRRSAAQAGLFLDNAETVSSATIQSALAKAFAGFGAETVKIRNERAGLAIEMRPIELYPKFDYDQTLIPGVVIMAIFLGAMMTGAFNLVMDRFLGVDESYLLTPLTKRDIVMGLVASGLIITTIIAVIVLFFSSLISGLRLWELLSPGSAALTLVVIILSTLGLQGMMFIIMGRINHPRIVGVLGGFLNVIFFFPSGAVYPVESFPPWLRSFASVNPESYSVHALRALLFKGAGFSAVGGDIIFLASFSVVTVAVGIMLFKRTL